MTIKKDSIDMRSRSSFIKLHLIKEIFQKSEEKRKICNVAANSFIYFDNPIKCSMYKIDRFGKGSFFFKNQVIPVSWASIDGRILLKAFNELKQNNVFVLKEIKIEDKTNFYKTRVKNVRK